MALISKSSIAEVNERIDAISIIGDYIRLDKKSGRWWGKCPFHGGGQEKTASFTVDPDLKLYHCFGCNKGGTVISFVMEMDNLTYPEAIKHLAKKTGTELIYEDGDYQTEDNTLKEQLYELYERITGTFIHFLKEKQEGQNALNYLLERGISKEMIDTFKLGYAPSDRNFLYNFLTKKGYSEEFLEKSGIFSRNYKTIPLFSARIIFPISDRNGKIVAFGGRALPGAMQKDGSEPPKYINSPETEIYKKAQTLYGIELAKNEMRKTKTVILAEGNVDVIALHQAGLLNAVAPLGTAFTDEQAGWLSRWVEKAILFFDTDEAGQKAAFKSILTCRKHGIACYVVDLKKESLNAKDPGEILQKFGEEPLKNALNSVIFDFEYLISITGDKNKISEYLFPYIDVLKTEVGRDDCIAKIADFFRIDKKVVLSDYNNRQKDRFVETRHSNQKADIQENLQVKRNHELVTLTVAALNMELYPDFRKDIQIKEIENPCAKELFVALEECFIYNEMNIDSLISRIKDKALTNYILSKGGSFEFKGSNARRLLEDGKKEIKKSVIYKRLTEIGIELRNLERETDASEKIDELLAEKLQLDEQIRNIEGK